MHTDTSLSEDGAARPRRTTILGAALAGLFVFAACGSPASQAPQHVATTRSAGVPQPPAGSKWVGVGRTVVAVPLTWPVLPGIYCGEPRKPYVTITQWHVTVGCEPIPQRPPVASISIQGNASGGFAASRAGLTRSTLPAGWLAVPDNEPAGGAGLPSLTSEIDALKSAGFKFVRRYAGPGDRWQRVTTDPEIGTPARVGSTIVVTDRGATESSATLTGRLAWVGGPAPGAPRPHAGIVHIMNADDSVDQTVAAGIDGRWTIYLPPGTYRVLATSPGYLSAAGASDACSASGLVKVAAGATVTANVDCQMY
jgi:hypothetical protein